MADSLRAPGGPAPTSLPVRIEASVRVLDAWRACAFRMATYQLRRMSSNPRSLIRRGPWRRSRGVRQRPAADPSVCALRRSGAGPRAQHPRIPPKQPPAARDRPWSSVGWITTNSHRPLVWDHEGAGVGPQPSFAGRGRGGSPRETSGRGSKPRQKDTTWALAARARIASCHRSPDRARASSTTMCRGSAPSSALRPSPWRHDGQLVRITAPL